MKLDVYLCLCNSCGRKFHEWENECLENCPHCGGDVSDAKSVQVVETKTVIVNLDHITGAVAILQ